MQNLNIFLCMLFFMSLVVESFTAKFNTISHELKSKSQITVDSEGGSIIPNSSKAQLSDYYTNLINLDSGLDKSNKSPIVARKKVDFMEDITISPINNKIVFNNASNNMNTKFATNKTVIPKQGNATDLESNSPKTNHKPLVLSYEALAQTDEKNKVLISENGPNIKVHELRSNIRPGMVMPIIITILVVPMFAVVGYMALKRGREAWKNRHYKRMDFLLDGMYNE